MAASADETLVEDALRMALSQRRPQVGLLHHTDRGCQSTSHAYQALLTEMSRTVSMSRKGSCWDNAMTESFFGTLKGECVDLMCFTTRAEARQTVFEFVECFYNRVRLHSSLGYISPVAFEQQQLESPYFGTPQKWVNLNRSCWLPDLQTSLCYKGIPLRAPFRLVHSPEAAVYQSSILERIRYLIDTMFRQLTNRCKIKRVCTKDL